MCGITGIISKSNEVDIKYSISKMTDKLIHRGPDGFGYYYDKNIAFGHRRLSIIDLSENGKQPMTSQCGRYTITFNGEIYNYIEIKNNLIEKGLKFKTNTDTEVLLELYAIYKEGLFQYLDGMFAFAIYDNVTKSTFCARDRFGEKPFFYTSNSEGTYFSSEMKSFWSIGIKKNPNKKRLYYYLAFEALEDPYERKSTFYEDIYELEPSYYMVLNSNGEIITKKQYWDIDLTIKNETITKEQAENRFKELLKKSVKRRLRSDVPVGTSLSGGLDSSALVYLINDLKLDGQKQLTFSARFKNHKLDESYFIDLILNDLNEIEGHSTYPTSEGFVDEIEDLFYHLEEPFGGGSIYAQWKVMQLAKNKGVTVLIDGQGADEIMGGYHGYFTAYCKELYKNDKLKYNEQITKWNKLHNLNYDLTKYDKLYTHIPKVLDFYGRKRRKYFPLDLHYLKDFNPEYLSIFKLENNPIIKNNSLKETLYNSLFKRGLHELLRHGDRNSMAFSVESRLPFLNHELIEFIFTLPNHLLINNGWTKYIMRSSLKDFLPKEIVWRKDKVGFAPPQKKWENDKRVLELKDESIAILQQENIIDKSTSFNQWNLMMAGQLYK
ncbi:asparagine synthase (glutamine-hydrolyzing) [Flammeovirga pectinis]|uniref:asparagine synthase (glutamine-hydrolyzing) n=1 Tax=Flammeovirga pectinis TaxID=2494373 RepID=A0A3S9P175_9BACT|nr:asparagine synthase (glutamine-hydrolyzing) [Flammeovirga pectinis]AZQ61916.1 asparagine synthase (glutamine-hydrolyzing) [Flammeovirga pectinis]